MQPTKVIARSFAGSKTIENDSFLSGSGAFVLLRVGPRTTSLGPDEQMPNGIAAKSFYGDIHFVPPALAPGSGRSSALRASRNDPNRIFRSFPLQQKAFDFCDVRPGYGLRVWSFEIDNKGRRRFIAASYESFWRVYSRFIRRGCELHFYEVIRERHASKLYFDLEFQLQQNPNARPEEMVDALVGVCAELCELRTLSRNGPGFVELDSTSDKKFSRHLIFQNIAFHDNVQTGDFARRVVELMVAKDPSLVMVNNTDGEVVPFVDLGVYTKNRCFRIVGSSKFGKSHRLLLRKQAICRERVSVSKDLFMHSLVCSVGTNAVLLGSVSPFQTERVLGTKQGGHNCTPSDSFKRLPGEKSPFPLLDKYIYSIIGRHGGGIYGVTILSSSETVMHTIKGGYKYCGNIGRHHKSNNVILITDLRKGEMYQKCFDPDCRGYRSPPWPLPPTLRPGADAEDPGYIDDSVSDGCLNDMMDRIEGERLAPDLTGGVDDDALNALMDEFMCAALAQREGLA